MTPEVTAQTIGSTRTDAGGLKLGHYFVAQTANPIATLDIWNLDSGNTATVPLGLYDASGNLLASGSVNLTGQSVGWVSVAVTPYTPTIGAGYYVTFTPPGDATMKWGEVASITTSGAIVSGVQGSYNVSGGFVGANQSYGPVRFQYTTAPSTPTNVKAEGEESGVVLTCDDMSGSGATSYNVYESSTQGGTYNLLLTGVTNLSTIVDGPATNGVKRWYKMSAVSSGGESALSAAVGATPHQQPDQPVSSDVTLPASVPAGTQTGDFVVTFRGGVSHQAQANVYPSESHWLSGENETVTLAAGGATLSVSSPYSASDGAGSFTFKITPPAGGTYPITLTLNGFSPVVVNYHTLRVYDPMLWPDGSVMLWPDGSAMLWPGSLDAGRLSRFPWLSFQPVLGRIG